MSWRAEQVVSDWERERVQWFNLNVARFLIGILACVAFAMALANYHY